ncbi:hypothetical protein RHGRI_009741 [Rhododendron griersonianum]|uniref:RING-type domain-containing protein n=1 Tax=Rhododendron griersonianum TaxID=479676 RepID=A0AAV6KFW3_9ERIC|nr:hypothetical protein RHGRI_009741 [Rhododendron griersonianum]
MGLPPYPTPADGGVLCVILVNTAISISIVRDIVLSALHVVGIRIAPWEEYSNEHPSDFNECRGSPSETYMEEFRSRTPAVRFDSVCKSRRPEPECSVCLTEFEPNAEINDLPCGHLFHKNCLEKWLRYWNVTCPLCRTPSSEPTEPYADSFAPTEMLLRVRPELRWYRQRKDPAWVVGEQRQLYFTLEALRRVVGDDGDEDDTNVVFFTSSRFIFGTTIFLSRGDSAIVCSGLS